MNLDLIEITPEDAQARLEEIHDIVDAERTLEDRALAAAYRAAKRGHAVISLRRAFELAGEFDDGLPKLAVVRATAERCRVDVRRRWRGPGPVEQAPVQYSFSDADWRNDNKGALVGTYHVNVAVIGETEQRRHRRAGQTIVPLIPPAHRPKSNRRLARCHILWEVEAWDPTPPKDPALIKHIRGDLWAVLSTWDLTPLEQLVLAQRARP